MANNWRESYLSRIGGAPDPMVPLEEVEEEEVQPTSWRDDYLSRISVTPEPPVEEPIVTDEEITKPPDKPSMNIYEFAGTWAPSTENNVEAYADSMVSIFKSQYNKDYSRDTDISTIPIDEFVYGVSRYEGFHQPEEWNLNNIGRPKNLSQEFNNPGMIEYRKQEGAKPSRAVYDSNGELKFNVFSRIMIKDCIKLT